MRSTVWAVVFVMTAGAGVSGCGEGVEPSLGQAHASVEVAQHGVYYQVAFAPARSLDAFAEALPAKSAKEQQDAYVRELSSLALPYWSSGSITVPALTHVGGAVLMAPAPATSRIRYSCGATLISPSYAITAGHCPTADTKLDELELQMYRPTQRLAGAWQKTVTLSGAWPELSHPLLDEADGYVIDRYPCSVKTRCYDGDINVACQNPGSDVALLECAGRPGDKYGFIDVSTGSSMGKEALMHWKHEVLDVHTADPIPSDYREHYVEYPPSPEQNFHYFETGNQLLALRSIPWPDGSPTKFASAAQVDVQGCHGSSGSGVLAREGESNEYRLAGPAALGGPGLAGRLCAQVPNPGGASTGPGTFGLATKWAEPQKLLTQYAALLRADCSARGPTARDLEGLPIAPGSHHVATLFSFLSCQLDPFARDGSVLASPAFGPYPERFIDDTSATERVVHGFTLEAESDYRAALQAQSQGTCTACLAPELHVGGAIAAVAPGAGGLTLIGAHFPSESPGPADVRITNHDTGLALGAFTLVREGQVNSFDTPEERLEAGLYALDEVGSVVVGPAPMRFSGDGQASFQAHLLRGERFALFRQALGPSHRWWVRLGGEPLEALTCGLLGFDGEPAVSVPCAELMVLDDAQGSEARLAFFVELPASSSAAEAHVKYVALASDSARDLDGDLVPEVLDNCPLDWNASQGDCSEEPPVTDGGEGGAAGEGGQGGASELGAGAPSSEGGAESGGGAAEPVAGTASAGSGGTGASVGGSPVAVGDESGGSDASSPPTRDPSSSCDCGIAGRSRSSSWLLTMLTLALTAARRLRRDPR